MNIKSLSCKLATRFDLNAKKVNKFLLYFLDKEHIFNKEIYFDNLSTNISYILSKKKKTQISYDILDTEKQNKIKLIVLQEKQKQMNRGEIWQEVLGTYNGFVNLKTGHECGLDIISYTKKIAIELKSRTNTDNSSSKKTNLDKLALFKKNNPEYTCIYANINEKTEEKTLKGNLKILKHNNVEIQHYTGFKFLNFILGNDTEEIILFVKNVIDK